MKRGSTNLKVQFDNELSSAAPYRTAPSDLVIFSPIPRRREHRESGGKRGKGGKHTKKFARRRRGGKLK